MKKSFILSCLALGIATSTNSLCAEQISINPSSAKYWNLNTSTGEKQSGGSYFARLETNSDPVITIQCENGAGGAHRYINNIGVDGDWFDLYTAAPGLQPQYVITVPEGYAITGLSAKLYKITGTEVDWYVRGNIFTSTTDGTELDVSGFKVRELVMECMASNSSSPVPTLWEEFVIEVEESDEIDEDTNYLSDYFVVFDNSKSTVPYRIPAIGKNRDGDLIAVCDYRYSKADIGVVENGKLDLRYRIMDGSTGEWGEEMTLQAALGSGSNTVSFGDPCIVGDRESNRMMVTSCCGNVGFQNGTHSNHMGWARFYSEDGGNTWGEYEDISDQVFSQLDKRGNGEIKSFFIGSGKISQSRLIKVGQYYRLYCSALVKDHANAYINYVFYSDDFGMNWNLLGEVNDCPVPSGADEPKADELPDGSVLVSSRVSGGRYYNIYKYDDIEKGSGKWGNCVFSGSDNNGVKASINACNGEVLIVPVIRKADKEEMYILLQSVPFGPTGRNNVGINYKVLTTPEDYSSSEAIASDWDGEFLVTSSTSAYSTMCFDKDNNIAFFMEENGYNSGYDMVYCKLTIDEITGGKYSLNGDGFSTAGVLTLTGSSVGDSIDKSKPVEIYDLDGKRLSNGSLINGWSTLPCGVYIVRQGKKSEKWHKN